MDQTYMKEKPILPLLLSMALPMVISMFVNSLYNIIDSIFVAKISEDAMTALSLVYPVQNLINSIAVGFGVGINAVIAMFLGAGKAKEADKTATQGLFLNVIHGLLLTIVGLMIMPSFLAMFTNDQTVIGMGLQYSTIILMFSTIIMVSISFEKIFQAVGLKKEEEIPKEVRNMKQQSMYQIMCYQVVRKMRKKEIKDVFLNHLYKPSEEFIRAYFSKRDVFEKDSEQLSDEDKQELLNMIDVENENIGVIDEDTIEEMAIENINFSTQLLYKAMRYNRINTVG